MERILNVAKTHMGPGKACVGSKRRHTFKNMRVLLPGNTNQSHPANIHVDVEQVRQLSLRR